MCKLSTNTAPHDKRKRFRRVKAQLGTNGNVTLARFFPPAPLLPRLFDGDVKITQQLLNAAKREFDTRPLRNLLPDKAYSPASIAKAYMRTVELQQTPRLSANWLDFPSDKSEKELDYVATRFGLSDMVKV